MKEAMDMPQNSESSKVVSWTSLVAGALLGAAAVVVANKLRTAKGSAANHLDDIMSSCSHAVEALEDRLRHIDFAATA